MNKIKKVIAGICVFISGLLTKAYAADDIQPAYAVKLAPKTPETEVLSITEIVIKIAKVLAPIMLWALGIFIICTKKINKKLKVALIIIIALITVLLILQY